MWNCTGAVRSVLLFATLITALGCDVKVPKQDSVPRGAALPIDGTWECTTVKVGSLRVRFDRGCAYIVDATFSSNGDVEAQGIVAVDEHRYKGSVTGTVNGTETTAESIYEMVSATEMTQVITSHSAKTPDRKATVQRNWKLISADNPDLLNLKHGAIVHDPSSGIAIRSLSPLESLEEAGVDTVDAPGESRRSESLAACVELDDSVSWKGTAGFTVGSDAIWAKLQASIAREAVQKHGVKLTSGSEIAVTAIVDASRAATARRWRVTWLKRVRKGVADWSSGDGTKSIPFKIVVGLDYRVDPSP